MSSEIKLGWYRVRRNPDEQYEIVYATDSEVVGKSGLSGSLYVWSVAGLLENYDYIGPELGEWVDADDTLMARELPIRARVRNRSVDDWREARLIGVDNTKIYKYCADGCLASGNVLSWYGQCQVWRPAK